MYQTDPIKHYYSIAKKEINLVDTITLVFIITVVVYKYKFRYCRERK